MAIERRFRNLPENKQQLCAFDHILLHVNEAPPLKPSRDEMLQAIAASAINIHVQVDPSIMPPLPYEGLGDEDL